ncbi:hypothetical protein [Bacillus horti]|uniref:Uncharacterized protein n=1 Tax=Caldalkalibacillus horti TaxID=77523 RepID=A0ABT9W1U4_9BACI|nr:hypothetical protein [Bacillus horti]MDQ0167226.1 hypothetical protein [Bacillus horti]
MKIILDPTLHIIDTEKDFIVTTNEINLAFHLGDPERKKIYELLKHIENQQSISENMHSLQTFEAKFLKVLLNKGVAKIETEMEQESSKEAFPFQEIVGPKSFLAILQEHLPFSCELNLATELNGSAQLFISNNDTKQDKLFVYIYEDFLYLSLEECPYAQGGTESDIQLEYAAYVLLEKLEKGKLDDLNTDALLKIDLAIYTNDIKKLATRNIHEAQLLDSFLNEGRLTGHSIQVDYESYFPLVYVTYHAFNRVIYSYGFDQQDAFFNLLYLIENDDQVKEKIGKRINPRTSFEKEYELDKDSFLLKFMSIYFNESSVQLNHTNDGKEMLCAGQVYDVASGQAGTRSLLISLYANHTMTNKGAPSNERHIIQT